MKHKGIFKCRWCLEDCIDRLDCNDRHKALYNRYKSDKFKASRAKKKYRPVDLRVKETLDKYPLLITHMLTIINSFESRFEKRGVPLKKRRVCMSTVFGYLRAEHGYKLDNSHLRELKEVFLIDYPHFSDLFRNRSK